MLADADVGLPIAEVVDREEPGGERPDPGGGEPGGGGDGAGLDEGGGADGDEAEEHHHEHVPEAVVGERVRPAGVGQPREDGGDADGHHPPPGDGGEVDPADRGEGEGRRGGELHGPGRDEARGHGAGGADAVVAVGALLVVEDVVGKVGADLDEEGPEEAGHGRAQGEAPGVEGAGGADQHRGGGGGEGGRADGEEPDGDGARAGGDGVGVHGRGASTRAPGAPASSARRAARGAGASTRGLWPMPGRVTASAPGIAAARRQGEAPELLVLGSGDQAHRHPDPCEGGPVVGLGREPEDVHGPGEARRGRGPGGSPTGRRGRSGAAARWVSKRGRASQAARKASRPS